jgi:GT2 family glycosyltransferase
MNYFIDDYKLNGNKFYIKGWAHYNNYKIIIETKKESIALNKYFSRYDICLLFNEPVENNAYGYQEEITFKEKSNKFNIYLITNNQKILLLKINNSKLAKLNNKVENVLKNIKRKINFLWREYHFLVPPYMLKNYLRLIFKKSSQVTVYNPNINSEYNEWLNKQFYPLTNEKPSVKIIGKKFKSNSYKSYDNKEFANELLMINDKYVCLINGEIIIAPGFYSAINDFLNDDYDLIYFDNDQIINKTYQNPIFKPDWSIDTLMGINYIGNCIIIKKDLVIDDDIYLNLLNLRLKNIKVKHIPKILYHDCGKVLNGSNSLKKYLKANEINASVIPNLDGITNTVIYKVNYDAKISIIIPTKDHVDILKKCIDSIYNISTYRNFEIIVVNNNSVKTETQLFLDNYQKVKDNFKYFNINSEFNYSYLNNEAVKKATGDYILLLNNDMEVITSNWLEIMLGYASLKHIGAVGAKLIFPDNTIQHAGIIMGKGGLAGHAHYKESRYAISRQYELSIPYNYSACTAACLMVKKAKFNEVNGLEETLKVAFNDVDFNLKLLKAGYYNVFLPNVELYHYESKSRGLDNSEEKQKRFISEWQIIANKWSSYISHDPFYNDNFDKNIDYMIANNGGINDKR